MAGVHPDAVRGWLEREIARKASDPRLSSMAMGIEFRFGGHSGGTATSIAYSNTVIHIPARMPEPGCSTRRLNRDGARRFQLADGDARRVRAVRFHFLRRI